jgi:hypothetical protein
MDDAPQRWQRGLYLGEHLGDVFRPGHIGSSDQDLGTRAPQLVHRLGRGGGGSAAPAEYQVPYSL